MLAKKIYKISFPVPVLLLSLALAGCTPAGPHALLKGRKYLDRGDYTSAVAEFKTATTLMATNAAAWNYYGVALQLDGQPDAAAAAYQESLKFNRDLVEVHYNLGNLWLEQNKPDAARIEFTAYTLRRNNDTDGWLKLGSAELRLGETAAAEKCFSTVLYLKPGDADAYNGLGLARVQRGIPRDAVKDFAFAIRARPDFAAAILNLAIVSEEYLRDNQTALQNYQAYLALTPRPANWDEVNALVNRLQQAQVTAAAPPAPRPNPTPPPPRVAPDMEPRPEARTVNPGNYAGNTTPVAAAPRYTQTPSQPVSSVPMQVVQIQPAEQIVASPRAVTARSAEPVPVPPEQTPSEPAQPPEQKSGFWTRVFGSHNGNQPDSKYVDTGLTPLPAAPLPAPAAAPAPVSVANFPRYHYLSPSPAVGDRVSASGAFTRARYDEQVKRWPDALEWYRQAARLDPSWYEAQYNTGVLAYNLKDYSLALSSYENALALKPDSTGARYNFALTLKAAGYVPDAIEELKKVLAAEPGSVRAHLTLGNLYAQSLHDPVPAREQYLKVLELDPGNPQATDIRFWLSAHPK